MTDLTRDEFMEMFGGEQGIMADAEIDVLIYSLNELTFHSASIQAFQECQIERQTCDGETELVPGWRMHPRVYELFKARPQLIDQLVQASKVR